MNEEIQDILGTQSQKEAGQIENFYFLTYRPNNLMRTVSIYVDEGDYSILLPQEKFVELVEYLCGVSISNKVSASFQESEWFLLDRENKSVQALPHSVDQEKLTAMVLKKRALQTVDDKNKKEVSVPATPVESRIQKLLKQKSQGMFSKTRFFNFR